MQPLPFISSEYNKCVNSYITFHMEDAHAWQV